MSDKLSKTKMSKRMSKLCWINYQKPKCPKECRNNVRKNIKNQSVKSLSKKGSKSTPYLDSVYTLYQILHLIQLETRTSICKLGFDSK
jgi:hypothetical protein